MNKNECTKAVQKSHEITPQPYLSKRSYVRSEVIKIIDEDRHNTEIYYADYLRKLIIKK